MEQEKSGKPTIAIQTIVITFFLIAIALTLIGFLSYDNFEKRYISLRKSAYETLAQEVKGAIENGLALGLSCEELRSAPTILANAKEDAEDIHRISLFGRNGKTLHQIGGDETMLDSLSEKLRANASETSTSISDTHNNSVIIMPLLNSFELIEGYIGIEYSTLDLLAIKKLKSRSLVLIGILLALVLIPLIGVVRYLVSPVLRGIDMMEAEFLEKNERPQSERNEIIHSAKQVMREALETYDGESGGSDE